MISWAIWAKNRDSEIAGKLIRCLDRLIQQPFELSELYQGESYASHRLSQEGRPSLQ